MNIRDWELVVVLLLVPVAGSCSRPADAHQVKVIRPAGTYLGAGATFPAPLYQRWFELYHDLHPDVVVSYEPVGSGAGVKSFLADAVDFAASDTAMTDSEIARAPRGVRMVPMTAGCVALTYNLPGFTDDLRLSRQAYAAIFLGDIRFWDDPRIQTWNRTRLPHEQIAVVTRYDSSGTTFTFTSHLSAISEPWRAGPCAGKLVDWPGTAMQARGSEEVAALVKRTPGAIGYVELGFADRLGLSVATLENKAGTFVRPSPDSTMTGLSDLDLPNNLRAFATDPTAAGAYPIVTFSWLLVHDQYEDPHQAATLRNMLGWCLTQGQKQSESFGYSRLPPKVVQAAMAAVNGIKP